MDAQPDTIGSFYPNSAGSKTMRDKHLDPWLRNYLVIFLMFLNAFFVQGLNSCWLQDH